MKGPMASNLTPIPPGSRMGGDISRMEAALRAVRTALVTAGVQDKFFAHDVSRGGAHTAFAEVYTTGEGDYDWQGFYHYYGLDHRSRSGNMFVDSPGPQWVRVSTEARLLWVAHLPNMLEALRGMPVHVSHSTSWRWDRDNPRPNGRARYVRVYEVLISQGRSDEAFVPEDVLPQLLKNICRLPHPLGDQHLFDWQEDVHGKRLFGMYGWNESGILVNFDTKALMEEAVQTMFKDFTCTVTKTGRGNWQLHVSLAEAEQPPSAVSA